MQQFHRIYYARRILSTIIIHTGTCTKLFVSFKSVLLYFVIKLLNGITIIPCSNNFNCIESPSMKHANESNLLTEEIQRTNVFFLKFMLRLKTQL